MNIMTIRIKESKNSIEQLEYSISQVADIVGSTPTYFSKQFRENNFGISPTVTARNIKRDPQWYSKNQSEMNAVQIILLIDRYTWIWNYQFWNIQGPMLYAMLEEAMLDVSSFTVWNPIYIHGKVAGLSSLSWTPHVDDPFHESIREHNIEHRRSTR